MHACIICCVCTMFVTCGDARSKVNLAGSRQMLKAGGIWRYSRASKCDFRCSGSIHPFNSNQLLVVHKVGCLSPLMLSFIRCLSDRVCYLFPNSLKKSLQFESATCSQFKLQYFLVSWSDRSIRQSLRFVFLLFEEPPNPRTASEGKQRGKTRSISLE